MKRAQDKRSPLTAKPLRVAGQSVDAELQDQLYDHALVPMMLALMMTLVAIIEWVKHFSASPPNPWLYSAVAITVVAWTAWKWFHVRGRVRALRLGRDGERAVAQYLEWFRTAGFFVFHDVPMEMANIDHVLIGPRGVYTIETKTLSKPANQPPRVTVTADEIRVAGHPMSRNPLPQAKAQARWLYQLFNESRFKCFVQPVVVFPGWFVEPFDMRPWASGSLNPRPSTASWQGSPRFFLPTRSLHLHRPCRATSEARVRCRRAALLPGAACHPSSLSFRTTVGLRRLNAQDGCRSGRWGALRNEVKAEPAAEGRRRGT